VDPVTIALLAVLALAGGGAGAWAAVRQRRSVASRDAMRTAVRSSISLGRDSPVSLFDLFWDLGASDFALSMLASRKLLLDEPKDLAVLVETLPDRVAEHGGYAAFVQEHLEAIQEYYRAHRGAGDRRAVLALAAPAGKALAAADGEGSCASMRVASDAQRGWDATRLGMVADRGAARQGDTALPLLGGAASVDVDEIVSTDIGRLLGSIFDGSIARQAKRWFAMRGARKLRDELDLALTDLYRVYATDVRSSPTSTGHLYDAAKRWDADATRIAALLADPPFAVERWALCGTVLLEEAHVMARTLAYQAADNIEETLRRIDAHAQRGDPAMAGYLVYVNRYAFFVGRMQLAQPHVGAIESALARLRTELGKVQKKGLL
jgi:hypothetical protein